MEVERMCMRFSVMRLARCGLSAVSRGGKKIVGGGVLIVGKRYCEGKFDYDLGAAVVGRQKAIPCSGAASVSAGDCTDKGQA